MIAAAVMWVRVMYFHDADAPWIFSWHGGDQPPVPAVPWRFGAHTFGDFILPFHQAQVPNPWVDYKPMLYGNAYPPVLMILFKLFTFLPYIVALAVFLALNAASMAIPVAMAGRRLALPHLVVVLCLVVFLTFPFVMVIDRGNAQGLLVLPLYLFAMAWREGRWRRAAAAVAGATALKLYPVLLVIPMLAARRFREAALAAGAAAVVTVVLFDLYPYGLTATLHGFLSALLPFSAATPQRLIVSNYSLLGMCTNLVAAASGVTTTPAMGWLVAHSTLIGYAYLAAAAAVVYARRLPFVVRLACALSVLTFALPLSYGYTLSFVFVVVAELLRAASSAEPQDEYPRAPAIALAVAVAVTIVPWPFRMPNSGMSVGTVLVPAAWLALVVTALVYGYGRAARAVPGPVAQGA